MIKNIRKTIKINESFRCEKCDYVNPKAEHTCRNHCKNCLYSKHVDAELPGDRKSLCKSLMEPLKIDYKGKKGFQILHKCLKCKKKILNKVLEDDNIEVITELMKKQNLKLHE